MDVGITFVTINPEFPLMTTIPCATVPLADFLDDIKDPRLERARLHSLHDIQVTTILTVICGADSWTDVELFGRSQHDCLSIFLDLPHGIPSHDIYGRVFALLDQEALERGFSCWVQSLASQLPGEVVAIDGKTARRHIDPDRARPGLRSLVMVEAEHRLVDRTTTGIRYFISSLPARNARMPRAVCRHWRVPFG